MLPTPGETRMDLAVVFIAAQLTLSYVNAGIVKLLLSGVARPRGAPWA